MKQKIFTLLLVLMGLAQVAMAQDADSKYAVRLLQPGTEAPDMVVGVRAQGDTLRLSQLRGHYVLIHFWASWCPDCRRETPALQALHAQYAEQGLQMVGISYDTHLEAWQKYTTENKMTWLQYSELRKWKKETISDQLYHIDWIPTLYLIDPNGRVVLGTVMVEKMQQALATAYADK